MTEIDPNCEARVLVNLMPFDARNTTAQQWHGLLGANVAARFDDDPRLGQSCRSVDYLQGCAPISEIEGNVTTAVFTGANLELQDPVNPLDSALLPLGEISYIDAFKGAIEWAQSNTKLTVYSCLAAHVALEHLYGLERERGDHKTLGVFGHTIHTPDHPLVSGLGRTISAPQSRWGGIPTRVLRDCGVDIVASHEDAGWLLATRNRTNGVDVFLQGHPEYGLWDLDVEYRRDRPNGLDAPVGYYLGDNPVNEPEFCWQADRDKLFGNISSLAA